MAASVEAAAVAEDAANALEMKHLEEDEWADAKVSDPSCCCVAVVSCARRCERALDAVVCVLVGSACVCARACVSTQW